MLQSSRGSEHHSLAAQLMGSVDEIDVLSKDAFERGVGSLVFPTSE